MNLNSLKLPRLFLILWLASGVCAAEEIPTQPNIVIVCTDDQAAWACGDAVRSGWFDEIEPAITPNMDRLAKAGAVFRNFFCTTPVCSPARAAFMTGRYASEFGIKDFIPHPEHKLFRADQQVALEPAQSQTFAELLKQHGYQTGLIGKWHLGDWTAPGRERFHPTNHGFDYFMGLTGGGTRTVDPILEEFGKVSEFSGLTVDILTDRALQFINQSAGKPFLLCLHTRAPHGAWLPVAPEDWEPYESIDANIPNPSYPDLNVTKVKRQLREYLASVSGIDRNLGRLLEHLERRNLAESTIVLFTSDHGYNMGHNGIWHKGNGIWATKHPPTGSHQGTRVISRKYRPNLYDHSLRVPMIVRWPGVIEPGTIIDDTATSLDVFPTIAAMASCSLPSDASPRGRSLLPLMKGETPIDWNQDLYAEYHMIHYVVADLSCYRTPHYKLVIDYHNDGRNEFYDLVSDPRENKNLIASVDPNLREVISDLSDQVNRIRSTIRESNP